ncbi:MAG: helix-turn-helix transcriptional regulator [Gammaproteobacteria bacterium]|nr:helix-turn-helix transcriptional regulator [Gammaproteobacteria bacterium]
MSQSSQLIDALKQELRRQRITYKQVAQALELSEASVKRLFAGRFFTLERLDRICELMNMSFSDLVRQVEKEVALTNELTLEQEREIVSDIKLLLMAYLLINHIDFAEIIETYEISETEGIRLLARLDRMKIIELQPGNRVRLLISPNFAWLPNGPIQSFFETKIQSDFFDASFNGPGEIRVFLSGMLSREANAQTIRRIQHLARELNELIAESKSVPSEQCFGTSLLIAMRPWEVQVFEDLRRTQSSKVF